MNEVPVALTRPWISQWFITILRHAIDGKYIKTASLPSLTIFLRFFFPRSGEHHLEIGPPSSKQELWTAKRGALLCTRSDWTCPSSPMPYLGCANLSLDSTNEKLAFVVPFPCLLTNDVSPSLPLPYKYFPSLFIVTWHFPVLSHILDIISFFISDLYHEPH